MASCLWNQVTYNWGVYSLTWGSNICPGINALAEEPFSPFKPDNPYTPKHVRKYMKIVYSINDTDKATLKTEISSKKYRITATDIKLLTEEDYLKEKQSLLSEFYEKKKEMESKLKEEYTLKQRNVRDEYKIDMSKIIVKIDNIIIR